MRGVSTGGIGKATLNLLGYAGEAWTLAMRIAPKMKLLDRKDLMVKSSSGWIFKDSVD